MRLCDVVCMRARMRVPSCDGCVVVVCSVLCVIVVVEGGCVCGVLLLCVGGQVLCVAVCGRARLPACVNVCGLLRLGVLELCVRFCV